MARKNILSDVILKGIRTKQQVRALRSTAREEIRAIKKAGGKFDDVALLEQLVKNNDWIMSHKTQKDIRQAVREMATIDINENVVFNYADYMKAKENIRNFNLGSQAFNALHRAEIASGERRKDPIKRWSIGAKDTQETANEWLQGVLTKYSSREQFFAEERTMYITNLMKSVEDSVKGLPLKLQNETKAFINDMLNKYMPAHNAKHFDIEFMYEPKKVIETYDDLAVWLGFTEEWNEFKNSHNL